MGDFLRKQKKNFLENSLIYYLLSKKTKCNQKVKKKKNEKKDVFNGLMKMYNIYKRKNNPEQY